MSTVLITIVGPDGQRDLSLPTDAPVYEFLPSLVQLVGGSQSNGDVDGWRLASADGARVTPVSTLGAAGIRDGDVLHLAPPSQQADEAPAKPLDDSPAGRTAAVLPARVPVFSRLWTATKAVFGSAVDEDAAVAASPPPGSSPTADEARAVPKPAELTVARSPSVGERVRDAWRTTDYQERLEAAIVAPRLSRCVTIAVVSPKGGVGKTTTTALLGGLLALLRRDRVVAVDTNPDFGSLGRILAPDQQLFVDDLLERFREPDLTLTELDAQLGRSVGGLMVLPAPTDPARMERLDEAAYTTVIQRLQEYVGILLLDCGTGLQEPAARAAIKSSDQLVLVTDSEPASGSLVSEAAALLLRTDRPITLIVNKMPARGSRLDLPQLGRFLPEAHALVVIPSEPEAASRLAAGEFDWRDAPSSWQRSVRELGVVLVSDWERLGLELED